MSTVQAKKLQFRDAVAEVAKQLFGQEISSLSDMQRSDSLTIAYLLQIENQLTPGAYPSDPQELLERICDKKHDGFVDFVFRDDAGNVTLIQSKYRKAERDESESDFAAFQDCLRFLCPETRGDRKLNSRILELIADIDWSEDNFKLVFLSLAKRSGPISDRVEAGVNDVANTVLSDLSDRSQLAYLSESDLNKLFREINEQRGIGSPSVELSLAAPNPASPKNDSVFHYVNAKGVEAFVGVITAPQISELYTRYGVRLFNLNIRNYIGDNRTNRDIRLTAQNSEDEFFFYNNGISAVATNVTCKDEPSGVKLICEGFSVINGAQTFRSIAKAHHQSKLKKLSDLRVLIRVTKLNYREVKYAEFLDSVTKYNNTQNAVRISDFRSNDGVQRSLVKFVDGVERYEGRRYLYRNKRTQQTERDKPISVQMDDFCRCVFAYRFGSVDCFGGLAHLYDISSKGGYTQLFGTDLSGLSTVTCEEYFAIWLICNFATELLKKEKKAFNAKQSPSVGERQRMKATERKYLVCFAMGELIRELAAFGGKSESEYLKSYAKPKWQSDNSKTSKVTAIFEAACDMVAAAYMAMSNNPDFVHRNFFRSQATISAIQNAKSAMRSTIRVLSS